MEYWIPLVATTFICALILSKLIISYLGRRLLDTPNARSSHTQPTPRGGGLAIVVSSLLGIALTEFLSGGEAKLLMYLVAPGLLISAIGICDDLFSLNIKVRLAAQFLLAITATALILSTTDWSITTKATLGLIAIIGLVWLTNLYNFMDGINGMATLEAIFVCCGMSFIFFLEGSNDQTIILMIILASACCGFLYWNFPAAKLFMGDAGSLFLGLTLGLLAVWTSSKNLATAATWIIMLGVFIVDASYSLGTRLITGQKFYLPHRSHAYQKLALHFRSHSKACLSLMSINLLWLLPLAISTILTKINPLAIVAIAYIPLIYAAYKIKAGETTDRNT